MKKLDELKKLIEKSFKLPFFDLILVDGEKLFYLSEHLRIDFQKNHKILDMIDEIQKMAENQSRFPLTDLNIINRKTIFDFLNKIEATII